MTECEHACIRAAEVISAIEYDRTGDFLATGNKGGQITIYSRNGSHSPNVRVMGMRRETLTRDLTVAGGSRMRASLAACGTR